MNLNCLNSEQVQYSNSLQSTSEILTTEIGTMLKLRHEQVRFRMFGFWSFGTSLFGSDFERLVPHQTFKNWPKPVWNRFHICKYDILKDKWDKNVQKLNKTGSKPVWCRILNTKLVPNRFCSVFGRNTFGIRTWLYFRSVAKQFGIQTTSDYRTVKVQIRTGLQLNRMQMRLVWIAIKLS